MFVFCAFFLISFFGSVFHKCSWIQVYMEVSTPSMLSSYFANGSIRLQYTPYCLDFHVYVEGNDFIYLLTTGSTNALYRSQSPYAKLLEFALSTPFKVLEILGIVNDVTKSSEVLLLKVSVNQV